MLVDVNVVSNPISDMIAKMNGNVVGYEKVETGIYTIGHFNFDMMVYPQTILKNEWPEFKNKDFNSFGVCDNYKQIIESCPELTKSNRKFIISITPVEKSKQPAEGGWRWHKWGPYIGTQKPKFEYLHDEPAIEKVFVYHIYEI